jgi:hypothetical protein
MAGKIDGVPDGWELVEFRKPNKGDFVINWVGQIEKWNNCDSAYVFPIVRKIEKPAKYRPFANAEEFRPHRDRWWRLKEVPPELVGSMGVFLEPPEAYSEKGFAGVDWQGAFELRVFDDGTPFGVKIDE